MLPLVGGLLGLTGSAITSAVNASNQAKANEANIGMARENMQFQERMSNTAYQRARRDMEQAGINPMLAFSQGGASTPSGSSAQSTAPVVEDALNKGISSAMATRLLKKDLDNNDTQMALNNATTEAKIADKKLSETNAENARKNGQILDAQMGAIKEEARLREKQAGYDIEAAGYDAIMKRVREGAGVVSDAISILKPKIELPRLPGPSTKGSEKKYKEFGPKKLMTDEEKKELLDRLGRAGERGIDVED